MGSRGPSITFSAYLTGGVPEGAPLWRDPSVDPGRPASERGFAPAVGAQRDGTASSPSLSDARAPDGTDR